MSARVSQFIQETIKDINSGLPDDYQISEGIEFEVSVASKETAKGGLDLHVVSGGFNEENQNIHKIRFEVYNVLEHEKRDQKDQENSIKAANNFTSVLGEKFITFIKSVEKIN